MNKTLLLLLTSLLFGEGAAAAKGVRGLKKGNPDTEDGVAPAFLNNFFGGGGGGGGGKNDIIPDDIIPDLGGGDGGGGKNDGIIPDLGEQTENAGDKAEDLLNNVVNFGDNDGGDEGEDNGNNNNGGAPRMYDYFIDERHFGLQDLFLDSDTFAVTNVRDTVVFTVEGAVADWQEVGLEQLSVQDATTQEEIYVINQELIEGWMNRDAGKIYTIVDSQSSGNGGNATENKPPTTYEVQEKTSTFNGMLHSLIGYGETEFDVFKQVPNNNNNNQNGQDEEDETTLRKLYTAKGDFGGSDFEIQTPSGRTVATLQKQSTGPTNWGDYYQLSVARGQDAGLMLSVCIVIDQMLFDGRGE